MLLSTADLKYVVNFESPPLLSRSETLGLPCWLFMPVRLYPGGSDSKGQPSKNIINPEQMSLQTRSTSTLKDLVKSKSRDTHSKEMASSVCKMTTKIDVDSTEGCTEPSVVVEVVNTLPPGYNLTGMKSQQGSPRVSDLDSSGGDSKFTTYLRSAVLRSMDNSADSDTSASESELGRSYRGIQRKKPLTGQGQNLLRVFWEMIQTQQNHQMKQLLVRVQAARNLEFARHCLLLLNN